MSAPCTLPFPVIPIISSFAREKSWEKTPADRRDKEESIISSRSGKSANGEAERSEAKSVPDFQLSSVSEGSNKLFWVVELTVSSGADLIDNGGLEIDEESARNVFTGAGFAEERVEGIVPTADRLV